MYAEYLAQASEFRNTLCETCRWEAGVEVEPEAVVVPVGSMDAEQLARLTEMRQRHPAAKIIVMTLFALPEVAVKQLASHRLDVMDLDEAMEGLVATIRSWLRREEVRALVLRSE